MRRVNPALPSIWIAEFCLYAIVCRAFRRRTEECGDDEEAMIIDTEIDQRHDLRLKRGDQRKARNSTKTNRSLASAALQWRRERPSSLGFRNASYAKEKATTFSSQAALQQMRQSLVERFYGNQSASRNKDVTNASSSLAALQHQWQSMLTRLATGAPHSMRVAYYWLAAAILLCLCCACCGLSLEGDVKPGQIGKRLPRGLGSEPQNEAEDDDEVASSDSSGTRSFSLKEKIRNLRQAGRSFRHTNEEDNEFENSDSGRFTSFRKTMRNLRPGRSERQSEQDGY